MKPLVESPESVGCSSERLARIAPVMQSYVDQRGFAGISTMLARRGKIIHFEQVGCQDRDTRAPLTADTIYRIYSMTKAITSVALMTLYEEGRFQLFDPLAKYLPAFGKLRVYTDGGLVDSVRPILVRDLLTHTAGLTYDFLDDSPVSTMYRQAGLMGNAGRTLAELVGEITRMPLAYQPGSRWHYSMGIDVAGHLIEVLSGQPLQSFLSERLFAPLGMVDTGFAVPAEKRARVATMYGLPDLSYSTFSDAVAAWQAGFNQRIDVDQTYPLDNTSTFARGGHGLFSTAGDYLRFAQMLLNRGELDGARILAPKIVELMHLNHLPQALLPYVANGVPVEGMGVGLGFNIVLNVAETKVPGSVGVFTAGGAAKTFCWVDPQEQLIGVLMTQSMRSFELPDKALQVLAYQALVG